MNSCASPRVMFMNPIPTGSEWIVPSNPSMFNADAAFREMPEVDWSETTARIGLGDTVYLYGSAPIQAIIHECLVVETGIPAALVLNDSRHWVDAVALQERQRRSWMRLRHIRTFSRDERNLLSLAAMQSRGMKGAPQGRRRVPPEISELISSVASSRHN